MVYLQSSEEWQRQTSLLLQARPTTTRITTKYNIPNLESPKYQRVNKRKRDGDTSAPPAPDVARVPRGTLTLKTYDPESGVVLKFKTDRAADVGRLITGLGRVGRAMAALPERADAPDTGLEEAAHAEQAIDIPTISRDTAGAGSDTKLPQGSSGAGGGGKKKKKGKK